MQVAMENLTPQILHSVDAHTAQRSPSQS